ncbi:hypothetical protein [Streptomyces sp. NPDC050704]|uniref:hypothetical protein n=1 Tax=Streptomyces sp. NPDC050704 TaxID=3157219 RepID=UPI003433006B
MTTTLERLAAEPKHDPSILLPNVWSELLHRVEVLCPCGSTSGVRSGELTTHEPKSTYDMNGQRRSVISDATGIGWTCRYSGRTVTLDAALARDSVLTPAEKRVRDTTQHRLESGITDTAPAGYVPPKPIAELFALADANGWTAQQAWAPRDEGFVMNIRVSRAADHGAKWQYNLSYFVAPGVARRTQFGLSVTPDRRAQHDTPSIKAIRAVIEQHPAPEGA